VACAAQPIRITSPAEGTVVNPAQGVRVSVAASQEFHRIFVDGGDALGLMQAAEAPARSLRLI